MNLTSLLPLLPRMHLAAGFAALAVLAAPALAAPAAAQAEPLYDLRAWSQDRPRACPAGTARAALPPAPWRAGDTRCVWRGLLQVQRWQAPASAAAQCTGPAAAYWAWLHARQGRHGAPAWHSGWRTQALASAGANEERITVMLRNDDGSWEATEWRWSPSPRSATRAWQRKRWAELQRAAAALQPPPGAPLAANAVPVLAAWEAALRGRPAETDGASWRWQSGSTCMRLDAIGISTAQVQIPYDESEGRREQRAAMQLLLARRHPGAEWLLPFSQLARPAGSRGGAKYTALWREGLAIHGQLWMPRADEQPTIRVTISSALPAGLTEAARAPYLFNAVRAFNSETAALAAAWDARHE